MRMIVDASAYTMQERHFRRQGYTEAPLDAQRAWSAARGFMRVGCTKVLGVSMFR